MATSTSVSLPVLNETEYFSRLINYAVKNKYAVAIWKLPNDGVTRLILSKNPTRLPSGAPFEELEAGFIFAPFEASADRTYLKADLSLSFADGQLTQASADLKNLPDNWFSDKDGFSPLAVDELHVGRPLSNDPLDTDHFLDLVAEAVKDIEQNVF